MSVESVKLQNILENNILSAVADVKLKNKRAAVKLKFSNEKQALFRYGSTANGPFNGQRKLYPAPLIINHKTTNM